MPAAASASSKKNLGTCRLARFGHFLALRKTYAINATARTRMTAADPIASNVEV